MFELQIQRNQLLYRPKKSSKLNPSKTETVRNKKGYFTYQRKQSITAAKRKRGSEKWRSNPAGAKTPEAVTAFIHEKDAQNQKQQKWKNPKKDLQRSVQTSWFTKAIDEEMWIFHHRFRGSTPPVVIYTTPTFFFLITMDSCRFSHRWKETKRLSVRELQSYRKICLYIRIIW